MLASIEGQPRRALERGHNYFVWWHCDGTLDRIHHALYAECREKADREASPTACIIDSQSVKSAEKGGLLAECPLRKRNLPRKSGPRYPSPHLSAAKNETPKFARRDRAPNRELPARLCDTETEPSLAHAPCSRALGVKTIKPRKNKDWLAAARGFELPNPRDVGGVLVLRSTENFGEFHSRKDWTSARNRASLWR